MIEFKFYKINVILCTLILQLLGFDRKKSSSPANYLIHLFKGIFYLFAGQAKIWLRINRSRCFQKLPSFSIKFNIFLVLIDGETTCLYS